MDSDEKAMLKRALEISEDNNQMLKKLVRAMRWDRLVRTLYWGIIIAISVGAFYTVQPYMQDLIKVYGNAQDSLNNIGNTFKTTR